MPRGDVFVQFLPTQGGAIQTGFNLAQCFCRGIGQQAKACRRPDRQHGPCQVCQWHGECQLRLGQPLQRRHHQRQHHFGRHGRSEQPINSAEFLQPQRPFLAEACLPPGSNSPHWDDRWTHIAAAQSPAPSALFRARAAGEVLIFLYSLRLFMAACSRTALQSAPTGHRHSRFPIPCATSGWR